MRQSKLLDSGSSPGGPTMNHNTNSRVGIFLSVTLSNACRGIIEFYYFILEINCSNCAGGNAPEILSISVPFLKIASVGIERMLYC